MVTTHWRLVTPHKKKVHENNIKKMFLLAHMLDQCAPSRAFSIVATINTSCGQLMISPRGDDDMVAQV